MRVVAKSMVKSDGSFVLFLHLFCDRAWRLASDQVLGIHGKAVEDESGDQVTGTREPNVGQVLRVFNATQELSSQSMENSQ